jgi:hypothetical protein
MWAEVAGNEGNKEEGDFAGKQFFVGARGSMMVRDVCLGSDVPAGD